MLKQCWGLILAKIYAFLETKLATIGAQMKAVGGTFPINADSLNEKQLVNLMGA